MLTPSPFDRFLAELKAFEDLESKAPYPPSTLKEKMNVQQFRIYLHEFVEAYATYARLMFDFIEPFLSLGWIFPFCPTPHHISVRRLDLTWTVERSEEGLRAACDEALDVFEEWKEIFRNNCLND